MKNSNWYYQVDLAQKLAIEYTQLPEHYGNMGSMHDMSDETLADLSFAADNRGFMRHDRAIANGINEASMQAAREAARELVLDDLRDQRNYMLTLTDVAATADRWNSLDTVAKYKITDYRQKLRDITEQPDIFNVTWPTLPKELNFVRSFEWPTDIALSEGLKFTLDNPAPEPSSEELKLEQWVRIMDIRDTRVAGGVKVGEKWFHTDTDSLIRYLGLLAAGPNLPAGIKWKTLDGSFVTMTPTLVQQVYGAAVNANNMIFQHAEVLRGRVNESTNPTAININTGWPTVYSDVV